jgi:hypothetical protein
MFEVIFVLFVCVCTWLAIREARRPRRKRKVKQSQVSLIEHLFGYPAWLWLTMKITSDISYEELLVTVQTNDQPIEQAKTTRFAQRSSGLWIPTR